eukprot:scaffold949_cov90-Cylindrotheca_fusiformis.AAC.2
MLSLNFLLITALALLVICRWAEALVISPSLGNGQTARSPANGEQRQVEQCGTLKIRTTKESDIVAISDILATSLVESSEPNTSSGIGFNFKAQIELLKTKAGVDSLLRSRIRAIESAMEIECPIDEIDEADYLRFLWSHETFRKRVEKSALLSNEPHIWEDHNFAYAPQSSCWLQHKMITALDASSGEIVGFCEVAMLSRPSSESNNDGDDEKKNYTPTILNLVTSPKYRRQGIATRLMQSASKYVQREWKNNFDELSLYVEAENKAAIALYQNMGYGQLQEVEGDDSSFQLYMAKPFVPSYA